MKKKPTQKKIIKITTDGHKIKDRIKEILCERRMKRGTDYEYWIIDGKNESDEVIYGIGSLIIIYESDYFFIAQGIISKEYSLSCSEKDLQKYLINTLERLCLDMDSCNGLEFMCRDYDIDLD